MTTSPKAFQNTLSAAANQMWAVLAPNTSRVMRIIVVVSDEAETAFTDGKLVIVIPPVFDGVAVEERPDVAVGLLAHELGHFLQPLEAIQAAKQETGAPHWLANVMLDVHGEALVSYLFPAMIGPLTAVRQVVHDTKLDEFLAVMDDQGGAFPDQAQAAALAGRFAVPATPFDRLTHRVITGRLVDFMAMLARAAFTPAGELPDLLREIMDAFPELKLPPALALPNPCDAAQHRAPHGALVESAEAVKAHGPSSPRPLQIMHAGARQVETAALRLARQLTPRFQTRRGGLTIVAPGDLDRREAARGVGVPFHMTLPGADVPAPSVVLAVDVSGSMWPGKAETARLAAQAIALAVRAAGGQVAGVLFDHRGYVARGGDDSLLFAPVWEWPNDGGTDFGFLLDVWERFPHHRVLVLTDGEGSLPPGLAAPRRRTSGIVIPDGDPAGIAPVCERVVVLEDTNKLPWVMGMLVPRTHVA